MLYQVCKVQVGSGKSNKTKVGSPIKKSAAESQAHKLNEAEINVEVEASGFDTGTPITTYIVEAV